MAFKSEEGIICKFRDNKKKNPKPFFFFPVAPPLAFGFFFAVSPRSIYLAAHLNKKTDSPSPSRRLTPSLFPLAAPSPSNQPPEDPTSTDLPSSPDPPSFSHITQTDLPRSLHLHQHRSLPLNSVFFSFDLFNSNGHRPAKTDPLSSSSPSTGRQQTQLTVSTSLSCGQCMEQKRRRRTKETDLPWSRSKKRPKQV